MNQNSTTFRKRFTEAELETFAEVSGWPKEILKDPRKQPQILDTVEQFAELALGKKAFCDEVYILPNGVELMGLQPKHVLPKEIYDVFSRSSNVIELLSQFTDEMNDTFKGGLHYVVGGKDDWPDRKSLRSQLQYVQDKKIDPCNCYLTELRYQKKYVHPIDNIHSKSALKKDVKHALCSSHTYAYENSLYWDTYDTGIFMGMTGSGKGLHTDQLLTANIGKNFTGYKFLAIWPTGEISIKLLDEYASVILARKPYGVLGDKEHPWLNLCHRIVLLKPGDCVIFTSSGAHQAMSISQNDELCMASYESMVPLHPDHVRLFLNTGNSEIHHEEHVMDEEELIDVFDDILDSIEDIAKRYKSLSEELKLRWCEVMRILMEEGYFKRHITTILESTISKKDASNVHLSIK